MKNIPTYNFNDIGREEKLVSIFPWSDPNPYQITKHHCHDYHELMIFYNGSGTHEIEFKSYRIRNNSVHIIPQNTIHKLDREQSTSGFTIAISNIFIEQLGSFDPTTNYQLLFDQESIVTLSSEYFSELNFYLNEISKGHLSESIKQNICAVILLKLMPFISDKAVSSSFIREVRKSIEANYSKRLSTIQYAELFNLSPGNLNLKIKKATNKTINQLQDDLLVSKIKRTLYISELSLKEIALEYGYDDYAYFSKFFRKHSGYSPSEFRALIKNIQEVDKI